MLYVFLLTDTSSDWLTINLFSIIFSIFHLDSPLIRLIHLLVYVHNHQFYGSINFYGIVSFKSRSFRSTEVHKI